MKKRYFQPEIETMPLAQLQALQEERLREQIPFVYENVKFYRDKMDAAGVKPEDIQTLDDIQKLPFLTKDDLKDQYPLWPAGRAAFRMCPHPVHLRHDRKTCCRLLYAG